MNRLEQARAIAEPRCYSIWPRDEFMDPANDYLLRSPDNGRTHIKQHFIDQMRRKARCLYGDYICFDPFWNWEGDHMMAADDPMALAATLPPRSG